MHHYCTYFDIRYLARGLALHASLRRHHARPFVLHALCLDDAAHAAVTALGDATLRPIALAELEAADPDLPAVKAGRSLVEYYFTLTPVLPRFVLGREPRAQTVTYLDSDLYFYSDPQPLFDELGRGSVLIIGHRYTAASAHLAEHGLYNVGWVTWRNDARGRECLEWYRQRCLEWCFDRVEDGKYADQKYLDDWPQRFEGVVVCRHRGANLAPWNVTGHRLSLQGGQVFVDHDPLIFYHFHRLRVLRPWLFDPGLEPYNAAAGSVLARRVYGPYLRQMRGFLRSAGAEGNGHLRLRVTRSPRQLLKALIFGRTLLSAGPLTARVHLEPVARPLLRVREALLSLRGVGRAAA